MRNKVFQHHSVSVTQFAFQACAFNHSAISPFRINGLRAAETIVSGNCVRPVNVAQPLTEEMRYAASEAAGVWILKRLEQESKS
jgi:hypothetical protein